MAVSFILYDHDVAALKLAQLYKEYFLEFTGTSVVAAAFDKGIFDRTGVLRFAQWFKQEFGYDVEHAGSYVDENQRMRQSWRFIFPDDASMVEFKLRWF